MPEITKLISRRRDTWLEICTTDGTVRLPVDKVPPGLSEGVEITDGQWAELCVLADFWLLYDKTIAILARREHFRRELEVKLARQTQDRDLINRVLDQCEEYGFIDTRRAAELTVRNLLNRGGLGTMRIRQELIRRGCPQEILNDVLTEATAGRDESAEIAALLKSRHQSLRSRLQRIQEKLVKKGLSESRLKSAVHQQLDVAILRLLNSRGFHGEHTYKLARQHTTELLEELEGS